MKSKEVTKIALGAALMALCSWIAVPIGDVPMTMQIFALCFVSVWLGWKGAFFAVLAYVLLGAVGVPVFSGFTGGVGRLLCPTGGYLLGFLIAAPLMGGLCSRSNTKKNYFIGMGIGVLVCHCIGVLWFWAWLPQNGLWAALVMTLPFLALDFCKMVLAVLVLKKLRKK